ncbi:MAG: hypothetical protein ABI873_04995 [Marmoricola sp.]
MVAIEHLVADVPTLTQLGGIEQLDGLMWMVCGIWIDDGVHCRCCPVVRFRTEAPQIAQGSP